MPSETELKLEIPEARLASIADLAWLDKSRAGPRVRETLVSVYFDTSKETLKRHRLSLRIRRKDGKCLQTVKAVASPLDRQEWEEEIEGTWPKRKLARRTALKPFASKRKWRKLEPRFETRVERLSIPLHFDGASVAMALDKGKVTAKGRELAVSEPDRTAAEGFTAIALSCLAQITANRAAVLKGDLEGIHQMRVGLRRLRAALSLFKEMLRSKETERIKENLKWMGEQLAEARDLDVFVAKSVAPMEKTDGAALRELKRDLSSKRDRGIEKARKAVAGERYRQIVLDTGLWAMAGRWAGSDDEMRKARRLEPLPAVAREILKRRSKKVRKKLRRLEEMDARGRHKLRIAVKKLRYATGFFAALFDQAKAKKRRRAFSAKLKQLQSALGRLNDIHVHEEYAGKEIREKAKGAGKKSPLFGLGFVAGSEHETMADCLGEAAQAGKRFARQSGYWS